MPYCLPHVRGGVSMLELGAPDAVVSSPRPWGCFQAYRLLHHCLGVFPTSVGVFLMRPDRSLSCLCLPHVRGGVSAAGWPEMRSCASSPRPWGCFPRTRAALY